MIGLVDRAACSKFPPVEPASNPSVYRCTWQSIRPKGLACGNQPTYRGEEYRSPGQDLHTVRPSCNTSRLKLMPSPHSAQTTLGPWKPGRSSGWTSTFTHFL